MNEQKNKKTTKQTIFVGLSGGVDSSVAASLLKKQGFNVVGVFIKIWQPKWGSCGWKEDRRDAMRVAMHLDITFKELDLSEEYQKEVADYMIGEYKNGRTPNPDVMCNTRIKFGAFLQWALKHGADFVATGHYARIKKTIKQKNNKTNNIQCSMSNVQLLSGIDGGKDQSYFLWQLKQSQLKQVLFPVGGYEKSEVRKIAKKFGLPTADKKDSQGICFIGKVGMKDFLKKYIKEKRGNVLNAKGEVIGHHDGAFFLTIGQRRGFTITKKGIDDKPYYVVAKDVKKNTVTVASDKKTIKQENKKTIFINQVNWIMDEPVENKKYLARFRHLQELKVCKVKKLKNNDYQIEFIKPREGIAPGQSLVVYDGQKCLGGGIIKE